VTDLEELLQLLFKLDALFRRNDDELFLFGRGVQQIADLLIVHLVGFKGAIELITLSSRGEAKIRKVNAEKK